MQLLNKDKTALLVIDVQGKLATLMHQQQNLFANVIRMIKGAQALNMPVLWTEQLPDKLGPTAPGIKIALQGVELFVKNTFSCCGDKNFNDHLKKLGRKDILVTGIETHVCVYQTCADLINGGYGVHLVQDAVSSRIESNYHLGVEKIKEMGAKLTSVEMCLFEMLKVAEGDQFRQVIQIVK